MTVPGIRVVGAGRFSNIMGAAAMSGHSSSSAVQNDQPSATQSAAPVSRRAWLVLVMLITVYVLNYLCRFLPSVLAKPIEETLRITDGQFGLITGFYFALFYTLISLPIGFLADKTSRSKVLACGCAIWSVATAACGFAVNFVQFAASYMAVGFGEAGGVPPSYALISDYFPPGKRGTALGLFNLGMPIGASLAIGFGAAIAAAFSWETAFRGLGVIGLVAVVGILVIVKEPKRGGLDQVSAQQTKASGFRQTLFSFFSRRSLVIAALAGGITQIITAGVGAFAILFMMREKGMTLNQVAVWYALMVVIVMSAGLFVAGRSVDRFTRNSKRAYGLVPAVSLTASLPFYISFVMAPTWPIALVCLAGCMFVNFFYLPSVITFVQQEVRPDQRALSGALMLATMNLIGIGLGPTFIGVASDYFHAIFPQHSLQYAFLALLPCSVLAIALFYWLSRILAGDGRKAGEAV
jgi:Arabinose efflux permease